MDVMIERSAAGFVSRGIVLTGLRGVGKTVLLNEMRDRAERAGWFVVGLEARGDDAGAAGLRRTLGRDIAVRARQLKRGHEVVGRLRAALETISAFGVKVGAGGIDLGVQVERGRADSGDIEVDMPELVQDLSAVLSEAGSAFGLFIDEMQDVDAELLRALLVTQHLAGQRGWPFYIVAAGLPNLPGLLAESRSYAERLFDYRTVSRLSTPDAKSAVVHPVTQLGVVFDEGGLDLLVSAADGFPYFLQEYGRAAWEVAGGSPITEVDAQGSVEVGLERLDTGFFQARWLRATRSERRMLVAMAEDGDGPSVSSEVARRMGLQPSSLGPYRAQLIRKGLVYAPEHGLVAYTVPGMASFVHRHREDLD